MGWEDRRSGRAYSRSMRLDGRPRKIYRGKGESAEAQAARVVYAREERQYGHVAWRRESARRAAAKKALREFWSWENLLVRAAFLGRPPA